VKATSEQVIVIIAGRAHQGRLVGERYREGDTVWQVEVDKETRAPSQEKSRDLTTGRQVCHKSGDVVTLAERKRDNTGWWLTDNRGGLSDVVIDQSGTWTVLPGDSGPT
jgi:hypothetical protein